MDTENNHPRVLLSRLRRQLRFALGALVLLSSLGAMPSAQASVTVLTFDDVATGPLTNQYASLGVMVSGVEIPDFLVYPAKSEPNVASSPVGQMIFSLNSAIIGDVFTVSAYVTGVAATLFAYDMDGDLVGQEFMPDGSGSNTLLAITSSGNPIARFEIHGNASAFSADDVTFATAATVPEPASLWLVGLGLLGLLAVTRRKTATPHAGCYLAVSGAKLPSRWQL